MFASKEEARLAKRRLNDAAIMLDDCTNAADRDAIKKKLIQIEEFLERAEAKLPTQAAFERDKKRPAKA